MNPKDKHINNKTNYSQSKIKLIPTQLIKDEEEYFRENQNIPTSNFID